jgi:hypothetical protein
LFVLLDPQKKNSYPSTRIIFYTKKKLDFLEKKYIFNLAVFGEKKEGDFGIKVVCLKEKDRIEEGNCVCG